MKTKSVVQSLRARNAPRIRIVQIILFAVKTDVEKENAWQVWHQQSFTQTN